MAKEIKNIIERGEDERLEFKNSFCEGVIETLVAMANTKGGVVLIGVNDNGVIAGVSTGKESVVKWVNEIKNKTQFRIIPDIEIINIENKKIALIKVSEYPSKPISYKGKYYKRIKNSNHLMTTEEVVAEYLRVRNKSWDMFIQEKNIEDIDFEKVKNTINMIKKFHDIEDDPLIFLNKFGLISKEKITNAADLLFGKEVNYEVQIGLFETDTIIKKSLTIKGDLFSQVDKILDFIFSNITKEYIITEKPQREERWQYPPRALREFVINSVVHRDYSVLVHSQIKIFRDKIIIWNPGKLPEELSIKKLVSGEEKSIPRNIKVAEIFKESGYIERYGSGIKRAFEEFKKYNLPMPEISEIANGFNVELRGGLNGGLSGGLKEVYGIIKSREGIKAKDIAKTLNKPIDTIDKQIKNLSEKNLIERRGSKKTGGYYLK